MTIAFAKRKLPFFGIAAGFHGNAFGFPERNPQNGKIERVIFQSFSSESPPIYRFSQIYGEYSSIYCFIIHDSWHFVKKNLFVFVRNHDKIRDCTQNFFSHRDFFIR